MDDFGLDRSTRRYLRSIVKDGNDDSNKGYLSRREYDQMEEIPSKSEHLFVETGSTKEIDMRDSLIFSLKDLIFNEEQDFCPSDFLIKINDSDKKFKAHRWVLAFRSEYFRVMLYSNFRESTNGHMIMHESPILVEQLLKFIYTGIIEFTNFEELINLLVAADKYLMTKLFRRIAKEIFEKWTNLYTIIPLYDFSSLITFQQPIKDSVIKYILSNGYRLIKHRVLLDIKNIDDLCDIFSSDDLVCFENDLMEFILIYITNYRQQKVKDINGLKLKKTKYVDGFEVKKSDDLNAFVVEKFDKTKIPEVYRLPEFHSDCEDFFLNDSDQKRLLGCIRPNLLVNLESLLDSFYMFDLRLIETWKKVHNIKLMKKITSRKKMLSGRNRGGNPSSNEDYLCRFQNDSDYIMIRLKNVFYFNQLMIEVTGFDEDEELISPSTLLLQSTDDYEEWKAINVININHSNRILTLNFERIVYAKYLRYKSLIAPLYLHPTRFRLAIDSDYISV